ncbi:MAG: hypothetical protein MUC89_04785 [Acetobacteraceae bacterium]|jgi:hypothetical protein|nr:hypothetical protein [Acetobacteraceae bacterium]
MSQKRPELQKRPGLQLPDIAQPRAARTAPDDPRFSVAETLERPEAIREAVASGRVRAINAETGGELLAAPAVAEARAASRRTAPEVALSTKVPDYVLRQLRRRYAESGITIRNQVLFALRLAGVEVRDADLLDERKRGRG